MTIETEKQNFVDWLLEKKKELEAKTDGQLADMLNVRQDTLSLILTGRRGPSAQFVESIMSSQRLIYGSPEYVRFITAAHLTNLDMERRRRRFNGPNSDE